MAWEHCDRAVNDDAACPVCGTTKAQWTVQWNATRTFTVSRGGARLTLELLDARGGPVPDEPYAVVQEDSQRVEGRLDASGRAVVLLTGAHGLVSFPARSPGAVLGAKDTEVAPEGFRCAAGPKRTFRLAGFYLALDAASLASAGDDATLRFVSEDGAHVLSWRLADVRAGDHFVVVGEPRAGVAYRGELVAGDRTTPLWKHVELGKVQDPKDPTNHLPGWSAHAIAPDEDPEPVEASSGSSGSSDGVAASDPAAEDDHATAAAAAEQALIFEPPAEAGS